MNRSKLERMELIAADTKKEFLYDKATGAWGWRNRDEGLPEFEFPTRFDALRDAVSPYLEDEESQSTNEQPKLRNIMFDCAGSIVTPKAFEELTVAELVESMRARLATIEEDNEAEAFGFCDEYEVQ